MLNDLRFAVRLFRRQSVTMALTAVGLALSIGVNTTAFSFVSTLSLQPIGVPEPDSVMHVARTTSSTSESMWEYSQYLQLRARTSLMKVEAWYPEGASYTDATGLNESVQIRFVSGGFFETMNGRPALGRLLQPHDDVTGAPPVALVSHTFWKTRLGSDPNAVGRSAYISGTAVTVVGVLEQGITGPFLLDQSPAVWMTLGAANAVYDYLGPFDASSTGLVRVVARVSSVERADAAQAEASAAVASRVLFDPAANPASSSRYAMAALVMAIVGLVLLLGCANVANLLLAGATSRRQEIATRLSLGASRGRIVRQLLTESTLIGLVSGALGLLVALLLLPAVSALVELPPTIEIIPDWRVYVFAVLASVAAGIIAGLAPARHGSRGDLLSPLKGVAARAERAFRPSRLRAVFLGIQAAASIVLIVLAALFGRAALQGTTQDLGFEPARYLSVSIGMPKGTPEARLADLKQRAVERTGT
jgi:predicted permease